MRGVFGLLVLCLVLAGCGGDGGEGAVATPAGRPPPTLMPTATGAPPTPAPAALATAEAPVDSGWLQAAPGVELRRLRVALGELTAPVSVVRLDPAQVRLEVGYAPDGPQALSTWVDDAGALAAINGSFFDESGHAVALLVQDGQRVGDSYVGRGGMFAVTPEGNVWLRGLADAPYDAGEPVAEALQGWPLLVRPGGEAAYDYEDGERSRRSAIAVDDAGRVLLLAAPTPAFTLREFAEWLAASDLGISSAMNLDGGSSTGLLVRSETAPERIEPFAPLPIVLLALPA